MRGKKLIIYPPIKGLNFKCENLAISMPLKFYQFYGRNRKPQKYYP
jgi:hypothetical protein